MYFRIINLDGQEVCMIEDYFNQQKLENKCIKGKVSSYKLIGNCAYSTAMNLTSCVKDLENYKANWNFIHNSTHICVECAIRKGKMENYYEKY